MHFSSGLSPLCGLLRVCGHRRRCSGIVNVLGGLRRQVNGGRRLDVRGFHVCLRGGSSGDTFRRVRDLMRRCPGSVHCRIILKSICVRGKGGRRTCRVCGGILTRRPSGTVTVCSLTSCCRRAKRGRLCRRRLSALLLGGGITSSAGLGIVQRFVIRGRRTNGSDAHIVALFGHVVRRRPSRTRLPLLCTRCLLSGKVGGRTKPILHRILTVSPAGATTHVALLKRTIHRRSCGRVVGLYRTNIRSGPSVLRFCFCLTVTCGRTRQASSTLTVYRGTLSRIGSSDGGRIMSSFCTVVNSTCRAGGLRIRTCTTCSSTLICGPSGVNTLGGCTCCLSIRHHSLSGTRRVDCGAIGTRPGGSACLSACT